MAYVLSVGTSIPEYHVSQETAADFARGMFANSFKDIDRLLKAFQNGEIESRQFVRPIEWYKTARGFSEKNRLYTEETVKHSVDAAVDCLTNPGCLTNPIPYEKVDAIFFISSTGLSTPSIEAKVMNQLPFSSKTKRIPIWGLGCAGGAAGLSRAYEYCRAYPEAYVLVIAAELCSLTFQPEDKSKSNLIGTSLFADGIAAVLIGGEKANRKDVKQPLVPRIFATQSVMMPDAEDVMGWEFTDSGFQVIFSRDIPTLVSHWLKDNVDVFLQEQGILSHDIKTFLAHPGGKKVIDAYLTSLSMDTGQLAASQKVLQKHGNMSSATIFHVIKEQLLHGMQKENEKGLIGALGPGFSSELLLFSWEKGAF
ncbi:3-oxoacyl-[acyl-carrier-protein] synthase III C-terminal domain-containing protein [Bacillus siamensis]|uniref:type III polyketide synthase n=1 Tax=Bacillus siamensis TaxID=659243 RepID=UPI002DB78856|nr:3-oxoacyl-[acyl-carrier-protein] synthase III C-terminal domain-containing protein [Bacillus siamensis]MEC3656218.1 3-oxoacyl-[acyl-carrier-protein] synthase III C-terminal domain-containing protein [Bacillus siamensis]